MDDINYFPLKKGQESAVFVCFEVLQFMVCGTIGSGLSTKSMLIDFN